MKEIWKEIEGYENLYEVSNFGNIRSSKTLKLRNLTNHKGYKRITLFKQNKSKSFFVHVLVAKAFIENKDPKILTQVNHIDENKDNNHINNLEWVDPKTNCNHGTRNKRLSEHFSKNGDCYDKIQKTRKERGIGRKRILCITTNMEFDSIRDAANFYNICEKNISSAAKGKRNSCGSFNGQPLKWKFI